MTTKTTDTDMNEKVHRHLQDVLSRPRELGADTCQMVEVLVLHWLQFAGISGPQKRLTSFFQDRFGKSPGAAGPSDTFDDLHSVCMFYRSFVDSVFLSDSYAYSLPTHDKVRCCTGNPTVHMMEDRFGWCQRCGMLLVYKGSADENGERWIYNHAGK